MIDEKKLIEFISASKAPINVTNIARRFNIKGNDRRALRGMLKDLEKQGKLARVRGKSYTTPSGRSGGIIGRLEVTTRGFGFVRPDWSDAPHKPPFEGDLFILERNMGEALDGDLVRAEFLRSDEQGPSGRIEEVIEHAHKRIVGRYQQTGKGGEVAPRNSRLDRRIDVPRPPKEIEVKNFDWVIAEIDEFTPVGESLMGRVVERLGSDKDKGIDVLVVLRDMGIIEEFPASVEQEVEKMHFKWEEDLKGRKDLRDIATLTIDPQTAKDFDDGLSVELRPEGGWRLYVHIADVAHFVRGGTALDGEALERSTSVYPVDRVVPMLPQKLSNYLCSLCPNEDRLAVTAVLDIDEKGKLVGKTFYNSVINSDYRLTYEQVQAVFDGASEETHAFRGLIPVIIELRTLAERLRKQRFKRGALDLDIPESSVVFDENGTAKDLVFYPRYESHQLVEECMLIANEAVAQFLTEKEVPLLYRVHRIAEQERLEKLIPALKVFGIKLNTSGGDITPKDIQKALDKAREHPAGHILRRLVLRALQRAEYDPENEGHFGLASDCYCHFTSPIRRYPDVIAHRQLKALIDGKKLPYDPEDNDLDELGDHASQRERRAQKAEWDSTEIKALEFMKQFEGDEFEGYIAGMQTRGVYIELIKHPVEGFVKRDALHNDHYDLDDTGVRMIGRHSGHVLKLGDKVNVRIDKIDALARLMDLVILDLPKSKGKGKRGRKRF